MTSPLPSCSTRSDLIVRSIKTSPILKASNRAGPPLAGCNHIRVRMSQLAPKLIGSDSGLSENSDVARSVIHRSHSSSAALVLHSTNPPHRRFDSRGVLVPKFDEVRLIEIGQVQSHVGERVLELIRMSRPLQPVSQVIR